MIYFLSDAHLGSLAIPHRRMQERRLVRFLDEIKDKAEAVYLLGDMFDFWYEYKEVVPKGFTRFLGKISELTDNGVEVHYFTGNHDIWAYDYLEEECGVILHRKPVTVELHGRTFYLAHGDGLGDPDPKFKFIRSIFHSPLCQFLFSWMHPDFGMKFGLNWAKNSRLKRPDGKEPPYYGEDKEYLVLYAKEYLREHPDIDFFLFGHRHIELDLTLARPQSSSSAVPTSSTSASSTAAPRPRLMILGDWISEFTYAVFDGEHIFMENYCEGEE